MAIKKYADGSTYDTETGVVINAAGDKYEPKVSNTNPTSYSSLLDTSKLDSSSFLNNDLIPFKTPEKSSIYPVDKLNADIEETYKMNPEQESADALSKRITEMNDRLFGRSEYIAEQEKIQGIEEKTKTISDLSSQLKTLQNEAQAIPLRLQEEAKGRGITAGGLAPIETSRLRQNAIQALTTSSLLEAARGNLTTAQTLVDRAVSQKYDPIKEEIEVAKANLDIILKSPSYTLAEKKQAQSQLEAQEAKKQEVAKQEENEKAVLSVATEAAKNGADSITLQKIKNTEDPLEATRIYGLFTAGYKLLRPSELSQYTENQIFRDTNGDIYSKPSGMLELDQTVMAYVNQINSGKIKLTNVPSSIRDKVALALNSTVSTNNITSNFSQISSKIKVGNTYDKNNFQEGDIVEYNGSFFTAGTDGKWRKSTTEEKNTITKGSELTPEEKKFKSDLDKELDKLAKGGDWGSSWNYLHNKYPEATNEQLDAMLNKDKYYPK